MIDQESARGRLLPFSLDLNQTTTDGIEVTSGKLVTINLLYYFSFNSIFDDYKKKWTTEAMHVRKGNTIMIKNSILLNN